MAYVAGVCFCGFWVLLELFVLLCWLFVVGGCWAVLVWLLAGVVFFAVLLMYDSGAFLGLCFRALGNWCCGVACWCCLLWI